MLAASLVFATHYKPWQGPLRALANEGHTGVALFFVLSGLLLGGQLSGAKGRPPQGRRAFWGRRAAKIYTLHTLVYLACLPFLADTPGQVALNLTLAKGLVPSAVFSGLAQSWSLTAELMCYAALPPLARLRGQGMAGALALAAAVAVWASFWWPFGAIYTVAGRAFAFCLGVAMAWWGGLSQPLAPTPNSPQLPLRDATQKVAGQEGTSCNQRLAPPLPWRGRGGWGVRGPHPQRSPLSFLYWPPALALAAIGLLALGTLAPEGPRTASTDNTAAGALLANTLAVPLLWAACLALTRRAWVPGAAFWQVLAQGSYAFYLIHIGPVAQGVGLVAGSQVLWQFVGLWLVAVALHRLVENPILKKLSVIMR